MAKKKEVWEEAKWDGTSDPEILALFDCYRIKAGRGYIWLRVHKDLNNCRYQFTSSQGANSENSYSGCLPPEMNHLSLTEAQSEVEKVVRASWE